jgi:hypothetical protein
VITIDPRPPGAIEPEATWCRVCGEIIWLKRSQPADAQRCWRHRGRNPCAIDDCKRSSKASARWSGNDLWICSTHWRLGCPPGSPERRIYLRFFRRAKRFGWNARSSEAFWRIWRRILAIARARAAGDIDEAEIRRLFGWEAAPK